jgi:arginyl-tRNA synthetase
MDAKQFIPMGIDGTSIYIARDLGGAAQRYDQYKFDKMIYVVAAQQDLHNKQLFKMLDLMGYEWANRLEHVNFGGWGLVQDDNACACFNT